MTVKTSFRFQMKLLQVSHLKLQRIPHKIKRPHQCLKLKICRLIKKRLPWQWTPSRNSLTTGPMLSSRIQADSWSTVSLIMVAKKSLHTTSNSLSQCTRNSRIQSKKTGPSKSKIMKPPSPKSMSSRRKKSTFLLLISSGSLTALRKRRLMTASRVSDT